MPNPGHQSRFLRQRNEDHVRRTRFPALEIDHDTGRSDLGVFCLHITGFAIGIVRLVRRLSIQQTLERLQYGSSVFLWRARKVFGALSGKDMPFDFCSSAARGVLALPELMDNIFLHSEIRDVLVCTLVCTTWRNMVKSSPTVQRHIFFVQNPDPWNDVRMNPALDFVGLKVFITEQTILLDRRPEATAAAPAVPAPAAPAADGEHEDEDEDMGDDNEDAHESLEPNEVSTLAQWHVLDVRYDRWQPARFDMARDISSETWLTTSRPVFATVRGAYENEQASWRRMLLCQPFLGEARAKQKINKNPNYDKVPSQYVSRYTKWMGSDVGPWSEDDFGIMAPYLRAGFVLPNGAALNSQQPGCPVSMRLSWGPMENDSNPMHNFMMGVPCGPSVHMAAIDLGWHGSKLKTRYPYNTEQVVTGFGRNTAGVHYFLDLMGHQLCEIRFERDWQPGGGHYYTVHHVWSWTPVPETDGSGPWSVIPKGLDVPPSCIYPIPGRGG